MDTKMNSITRNDIEVCKLENFVYVRNFKCASTFFYWNFVKQNGWQEISWHDIDWGNNHVFGHILDPVERRHKSVAEKIHMHGMSQLFLENKNLQECLAHLCLFDTHTESYDQRYGQQCNQIDWIPLNRSHDDVIALTEKLLSRSYAWNMSWVHWGDNSKISNRPGDNLKKQVEFCLKSQWVSIAHPEWLQLYMSKDVELYNKVVEKFNDQAKTWSNTSWLFDH